MASRVDVSVAVKAVKGSAVEFLRKPVDEKMLLTALQQAYERSSEALQREGTLRTLRHAMRH